MGAGEDQAKAREASVDCEAGRRLGCRTFCCHLLVRLDPEERRPGVDGSVKGFVDKDENGRCVHMDVETYRCAIWKQRPRVCREYDCNGDLLLQVVVRQGFTSIARLVQEAAHCYIPKDIFISVPLISKE